MRGKSGEANVIGSELELEFEVRCGCQLCNFRRLQAVDIYLIVMFIIVHDGSSLFITIHFDFLTSMRCGPPVPLD